MRPGSAAPEYAELEIATGFSFLRGASRAEELAATASALGLSTLGVADRNTVAGVVRMHDAVRQVNAQNAARRAAGEAALGTDLTLRVGCRLVFADGTPDLLCYPETRDAWGRLTRMLTAGKLRARKGECVLRTADLAEWGEGQVLVAVPPPQPDQAFEGELARLAGGFRGQLYLAATRRHRPDDGRRLRRLAGLAASHRLRLVATNDVLYHLPSRRALHDVLTCIRLGCTIDEAGLRLQPHGERHLKSPREMERLFRGHPDALAATTEIVARCGFSLDQLSYEYPDEPVPPSRTPDEHLAALTWEGAADRYPDGVPPRVAAGLRKELGLIASLDYARYFLTVHDLVRHARSLGILCQGRGSAANSAVCYCLGVTAVNPAESELLFERFISVERREPPDIDVDFEHERREEVIQYLYARYGRHRAGLAATVIHYRPRMAMREVAKALGLPPGTAAALAAQSWTWGESPEEIWNADRLRAARLDPADSRLGHAVRLARELVGLPRHLSQHVGGFVLTRFRLDETVPIGPGAMPGRTFIEWDKDDIDQLGLMKVDGLALGMLSCVRRAFDLLRERGIEIGDLARIPRDDPAVYAMLSRADTVGVFQVESRAQMNMLPRLRPARYYDLVIEVAIVRPGPIAGDMVHPYLRRRQGKEKESYPSPAPEHGPADELKQVLGRTLGVPLFQEQAMSIAIRAAGFTPEEANQLRRAMATFRDPGRIGEFHAKMVEGMVRRGYPRDFAEGCFRQIEGFGTYGFPESHAASFALLVYVSAWLKCHHPAAFACALLNAQPMGFYAPAQIVRDAREHGVPVRGPDACASGWDCHLDPDGGLRLGLRLISGFRAEWAAALVAGRGSFWRDLTALAEAGLPRPAMVLLAEADALRGLGLDRRAALWAVRGLPDLAGLPLLEGIRPAPAAARLPPMRRAEGVVADYQATGLSLRGHPLRFLRSRLAAEGARSCAEAAGAANGTMLRVAGLVLVRQRPGTAGGVVFATIEDETGTANVVIRPELLDRYRGEVIGAGLLLVAGRVHRSPEGVAHVVAEALHDRTADLRLLSQAMPAVASGPHGHPRDRRVIPRSRDFR